MADVLIRGVDTLILETLKENAKTNGRSLQAELQIILKQAAERPKILDRAVLAEKIRQSLSGREHSDSTELLREDRNR
jgi:plasmid stability protein